MVAPKVTKEAQALSRLTRLLEYTPFKQDGNHFASYKNTSDCHWSHTGCSQDAIRSQNSCQWSSVVAQRRLMDAMDFHKFWACPKLSEVVAERMPRKMVAQWWLEGCRMVVDSGRMVVDNGRMEAEWLFNDCHVTDTYIWTIFVHSLCLICASFLLPLCLHCTFFMQSVNNLSASTQQWCQLFCHPSAFSKPFKYQKI